MLRWLLSCTNISVGETYMETVHGANSTQMSSYLENLTDTPLRPSALPLVLDRNRLYLFGRIELSIPSEAYKKIRK